MGSFVELNDTLQISVEQGFPSQILDLARHQKKPIPFSEVKEKIFEFHDKPGARIYHPAPCRCFLVQNISGKWVYWGKIMMLEQTIQGDSPKNQTTSGKYKITVLYDPVYQKTITKNETNPGESYF